MRDRNIAIAMLVLLSAYVVLTGLAVWFVWRR